MHENTITENEAQTLRVIARYAEEVEGYRMAVARESDLGTGDLTFRVTRLMEASLKLDGMVAVAEESGLFSRAGGYIRRLVLEGRAPYEDHFELEGVAVISA